MAPITRAARMKQAAEEQRAQQRQSPKKWLRSSGPPPPTPDVDMKDATDDEDTMDEDTANEIRDSLSSLPSSSQSSNVNHENNYLTPHSSLTTAQLNELMFAPKKGVTPRWAGQVEESPHALTMHGASPWVQSGNGGFANEIANNAAVAGTSTYTTAATVQSRPRSPIPRCMDRIGPPRSPMWDGMYNPTTQNNDDASMVIQVSRVSDADAMRINDGDVGADTRTPGPARTVKAMTTTRKQLSPLTRSPPRGNMSPPRRLKAPPRTPGYSPNGFPLPPTGSPPSPGKENGGAAMLGLGSPFRTPQMPIAGRVYHLPVDVSPPSPFKGTDTDADDAQGGGGSSAKPLTTTLPALPVYAQPRGVHQQEGKRKSKQIAEVDIHFRLRAGSHAVPQALGPHGTHLVLPENVATNPTRELEYFWTHRDVQSLFKDAHVAIEGVRCGMILPEYRGPHGMHLVKWDVVQNKANAKFAQRPQPRKLGPHGTHLVGGGGESSAMLEEVVDAQEVRFKTLNEMMSGLGYERVDGGSDYAC